MEIEIGEKTSFAIGDFGSLVPAIMSELEGRKIWKSPKRLQFETTAHNARVFEKYFGTQAQRADHEFEKSSEVELEFVMPPLDYQLENFLRFRDMKCWAIFSDPGTGKTKTCFDILSYAYKQGRIDAAVIFSYPKGVHAQWIEEQMSKHLWKSITPKSFIWDGKKLPTTFMRGGDGKLSLLSCNIETLQNERPRKEIAQFCAAHKGRIAVIIDESDAIKNFTSQRNKSARELANKYEAVIRGIMSGTPVAKDLTDEWAQFYFLDPAIIGHKYKTSFMAQFCRMGGFENRQVIGHRNIDEFRRLTAPYIFRAEKSVLNLPEKIYDEVVFDLSDDQRRMIDDIREIYAAEVEGKDAFVRTTNAMSALVRIQQVSCGYAVDEADETHWLKDNPRLRALEHLCGSLGSNKRIVWARFRNDVELIESSLKAVKVYGGMTDATRSAALERFIDDPECLTLVANPAALGRGVDGLQRVCSFAIYYSNSYDAIQRWQSEDRIQRIGMLGTSPTYFDLIARGSPDRRMIANIKNKKSLSSLAIDDLEKVLFE